MTDEQDKNQRSRVDRHAQDAALAEKVPSVAVDRVGGEDSGKALVEQIDGGAQDDQRHQRGEERPCFEIADQQSIPGAHDGACRQCGEHR